jgi:hypothetical protein
MKRHADNLGARETPRKFDYRTMAPPLVGAGVIPSRPRQVNRD